MKTLTRCDLKNLTGGLAAPGGGQNCCAHTSGWGSSQCGYSNAAEAQAAASQAAVEYGVQTFYCCDCAGSPGYPGA